MLKLTLLRHAKTNQVSETGLDYDRNLLPKGKNQGKRMNDYFLDKCANYDKILVSSANRTRQTFELIGNNFDSKNVTFLDAFYLCSATDLFDEICKEKVAKNILIVGHNFGISDLASYLTEKPIELRTCELIELSFSFENWQELSKGTATVVSQYRPEV